jgi:gliding motility-associated-like protein
VRLLLIFIFLNFLPVIGQTLSSDYGNFTPCSGPIALYTFDFTNTQNNTISQANIGIQNSNNQCCTEPDNSGCLFFNVYVDPGATGVQFQQSGAGGNIQIYYANCGSIFLPNVDICLDPSNALIDANGNTYHRFMFCRSGNTTYTFTFVQIPPVSVNSISASLACNGNLIVSGLDESSITWTSISPGAEGAYNSYLSTTAAQDTVVVTPGVNAPSSISYKICGTIAGSCSGVTPICDTAIVTITPPLAVTISPLNPTICGTQATTITANPTGGVGSYSYNWSNGGTNSFISINSAGTYSVSVTDNSIGCPPASASVTVTSVSGTVTAGSNSPLCTNGTLNLTAEILTGATYSWSGPGGFTSNLQNPSVSNPVSGIYSVTANQNGCPATASVNVTVNPLPTVNAGADQLICENGTTSVTATGASTYVWTPAVSNGVSFTATTSGNYSVIGTDANGCQNTDFLVITFDNIPPTASNPPSQSFQCISQVPVPDPLLVTDEADNNGIPTVAWLSDVTSGFCPTTITRTYRVTDLCGNFIFVNQTITVVQTTGLVVPANSGSTVNCPALAQTQPTAPVVVDVCGNTITPVVTNPNPILCEGTMIWIFTYTDCAGNSGVWTYTYTINYTTPLTAPANGSSTISCPSAAVNPGAPPSITDACNRTVNPILVGSTQTPNPVTCEGTVVWTYSYTACDGTNVDWTYTYTIDYSGGLIPPTAGASTISCPNSAVNPGTPPPILDACGRTIAATLVNSTQIPNPLICEGTVVWRYRYTACEGTSVDWIYTYTIDYSNGLTAPASGSSTVSCPNAAVNPGPPANITDACGRTVTPVLIGQDYPSPACEGTVIWRYRFTACDNNSTTDWLYTYNVDIPIFTIPYQNGSSTVNCPNQAINPGSPGVVVDQCGNILTPSISAPSIANCTGGTMKWIYTYTDCGGNSVNWTYTYFINMPPFIISQSDGSSIVNCPDDALLQPVHPTVYDNCGNAIIPVITPPVSVLCEGNMIWTFTYTDCSNNTDAWIYTYTVNAVGNLTVPPFGSSTVSCPSQAVDPGAPVNITDACGRSVSAFFISSTQIPNPITCDGEIIWLYRYTSCDGMIADWTYTYTILYAGGLAPPVNGSSTVSCPNAAVDPGAPINIFDACGRSVSATLVNSTQNPNPFSCEGSVVWLYQYTACDGTSVNWTYTYTIDYIGVITPPPNGSSLISCPNAAVNPGAPANITDVCGRVVTPVLIGQDAPTPACEGTVVWRYRYTTCDGSYSVDWIHIYTIDLPTFSVPANSSVNVSCVSEINQSAINLPFVMSACGSVITPTGPVIQSIPNPIICSGLRNYVYTYTDCSGNSANWTFTFIVDDNIPPFASDLPTVNVTCLEDVPLPNNALVTNATDNCGVQSITWTGDVINDDFCPIIERTYTITDFCGNTTQISQIFNVIDNIPPNATVNDTVFLLDGPIPSVNLSVISTISDNCSAQPVVSFVSETISGACPTVIDRIYRVTDNCQNEIFLSHTTLIQNLDNNVSANFSFTPSYVTSFDSTISFINSSDNATQYQWFFGDGYTSNQFEPEHTYNGVNCYGFKITLVALDGTCTDTTEQYILCDRDIVFYVPNTFTPDGDDHNQSFYPVFNFGVDPYDYELLIFDRWGGLVFESHNLEYGWDGSYSNKGFKVQDGVYTWKISFDTIDNNNKHVVVGHVNILR